MMPKMKICAPWVLAVFLSGCACPVVPVACSAGEAPGLVENSWECIEVPRMERGIEYPLPDGRHELLVLELADGEYSKCLACRDSSGELVSLVKGERTFGYAVCRHAPQYLLVFNNFASKQNLVLLYRLSSSRPVLCYAGAELDGCYECRVSWRVASWSRQGILLVGSREAASDVYWLLPLE